MRDVTTAAKSGNPDSHPPCSSRNRRNWPIAEVELGSCNAMYDFGLFAAKLYKGSRVASRFLTVLPNQANTMVTYSPALNSAPNQQSDVASLTSSVNGTSSVCIARRRRRSRRIAYCIVKKSSVNPYFTQFNFKCPSRLE